MRDCVGSREPCIYFNGSQTVEESPHLSHPVGRSVGRSVESFERPRDDDDDDDDDDDGRRAR